MGFLTQNDHWLLLVKPKVRFRGRIHGTSQCLRSFSSIYILQNIWKKINVHREEKRFEERRDGNQWQLMNKLNSEQSGKWKESQIRNEDRAPQGIAT